jgi:hypothetical protein
MRPATALLAAAWLLSGCATAAPEERGVQSISYETGPCFGSCPVYRVVVDSRGNGRFEGRKDTAVVGERAFTMTREKFAAFARHLEPLRPKAGTVRYAGEACTTMATDLPSTEVVWTGADGERQTLYFYHGCDMEKNKALSDRLEEAQSLLDIAHLIGPPSIIVR